MVNENSVNQAYFRKTGHACCMNRKGFILVHLGQFKDETSLFGGWKCQKMLRKLCASTRCNRCLK